MGTSWILVFSYHLYVIIEKGTEIPQPKCCALLESSLKNEIMLELKKWLRLKITPDGAVLKAAKTRLQECEIEINVSFV